MAEQKEEEVVSKSFIEQEIEKDLAEGVYTDIMTRFPPEPNGYLHIGHAKSILLNRGLAKKYGGKFNLRFDDTNPQKEDEEYVHSILEDVTWICEGEKPPVYFASDYFDQMFDCAVRLIKKGKAYVCDLTPEEIREYRGTLTEPGKNSPYRDRSVEENMELFLKMKNGEYKDGEKVLRAKIDMSSPAFIAIPIPTKPFIAPPELEAAAFMASACAPTRVAPAIFGFCKTAVRWSSLIISASSGGSVTDPSAMLTTLRPRSSPHFVERAVFIASSNSVLWETIWFGRSSKSDNFPKPGCNALMNSVFSWLSISSLVYSRSTFPQTLE